MSYFKIKSYAKLNLALNIVGKRNSLHRIESIISFINLYDLIKIKKIKSKKHKIRFNGKFSKNISSKLSNARFSKTFGQIFIENDSNEYFQFLFFFLQKKNKIRSKKLASFNSIIRAASGGH